MTSQTENIKSSNEEADEIPSNKFSSGSSLHHQENTEYSTNENSSSSSSSSNELSSNGSTDHMHEKQLKKKCFHILIVINVIAFTASFSYWNQNGVLPYLTRKLGVDPKTFGYLESTFAIYQMIGSPIFGRCGDVFGTRGVMIVSEFASSITYGSLAFISNIPLLFLSRLPAFFMHNLQGSYMIITDVTFPKDRANMLGKLGVSHGLGMVAGSFVGGIVTDRFNEQAATIVAACGSLVCVVIIFLFIPDDTKSIRRQLDHLENSANRDETNTSNTTNENQPSFSMTQMCAVLKLETVRYLLFIKILSAFPFSLLYSMFTIAMMDYYHLGPYHNGIILAYIGVVGIIVQGYLIGLFTRHFTHPTLVKYAILLKTTTFLLIVVAENIFVFCALLIPLSIGAISSHIVLLASLTKVVHIDETGTILGVTLALHGLVRAIAPSIGGLIFVNIGWPFFGVIGYLVHLFLSGFVILNDKGNY